MGAFFPANNVVSDGPIVTDYPFSVGMWVNLLAVNTVNHTLWSLTDTGSTNNYFMLRITTAELLSIVARAGGTENAASVSTALSAGQWAFAIARFISSTNRRLSVLHFGGAVESASTSTARAPTGVDRMCLGINYTSAGELENLTNGLMAEYWLANADIGFDSAGNLPDALVRQLAYEGPFSVQYVHKSIIEYHSFRADVPTIDTGYMPTRLGEVYYGGKGINPWRALNVIQVARHPPLSYRYIKPGQNQTVLTI